MDPLTHIVVGRAVVAAADRHDRAPRGVAAAAILGALSPDIDAAIAFSGWDRYLRIHEFATHSLAGALVMACLTAVVVRAMGQLRDWYGDPERVAPHLKERVAPRAKESVAPRVKAKVDRRLPGSAALLAAPAACA